MTAQTVSAAVATREASPVGLMWTRKAHFAAVLPDHIDVKAFLGTAAGALYASDDLMTAAETSPDSLITALMRCAALGHQPGTDEFYLTPRKVKGRPVILGIEGYRGIIERMYRSGAVASVVVREVCANDRFRYVEGADDKPLHSTGGGDVHSSNSTGADFFGATGSRNRGQMVGVYAYAILTTGAVSRVVLLSRDDIMAARDASDSKNSDYSPWNRMDGGKDHPEFQGRAMWWKTAARRLEPWVPTSAEYRREQLRASAAASDLAGGRVNGAAPAFVPPAEAEIHDAEIVEPGPTGAGAGPEGTAPAAGRPTGAQLGKLGRLLKQVPLGTPDDDAAFLEWQAGRPVTLDTISRDECAAAAAALTQALEGAHGSADEAASLIWAAWKAVHEQASDDQV
jgi:recombination protein RecT